MIRQDEQNELAYFFVLVGVLQLLFASLKIVNILSWSWLWILSPLWIGTALVTSIFVIGFLFIIIREEILEIACHFKKDDDL